MELELVQEMPVYEMPESSLAEAESRIATANRRAAKAGIAERIEYTVEHFDKLFTTVEGMPVYRGSVRITITSTPQVKIAGWTFKGVLTTDVGITQVLFRTVPGASIKLRPHDLHCDVCGTHRMRNETYVVENDETGEQIQVGGNCVVRYFGIEPKGLWLMTWDALKDLDEQGGDPDADSSEGYRSFKPRYQVIDVIKTAVAAARAYGWMSAAKVREQGYGTSTAEVIRTAFQTPSSRKSIREVQETVWANLRAEDIDAVAAEVLIAGCTIEGNDEYQINMRAMCSAETCADKNVGFVASAYAIYLKQQERVAEQKAAALAPSTFQGAIRERITRDVVVTGLREMESQWGVTTLISMLDAAGNRYKWFASSSVNVPSLNDKITITGTVKAHDEYRSNKETLLERCKIK